MSVSIRVVSSATRRIIRSRPAGGGVPRCLQYSANPRTTLTDVRRFRLASARTPAISCADRRAAASAVPLVRVCSETLISARAAVSVNPAAARRGRRMARARPSPAAASSTSTPPAAAA
jgi:hypothetical protein